MKLGEMINAYGILGEAKMTEASVDEVLKVFEIRKVMRPHVEAWNAFYKDVQEKAAAWANMTDEQKTELNKAVEAEADKDIEISFDKLDKKTLAVMIKENGYKVREIDSLRIMVE